MANATYEQALSVVQALPLEDQQRLRQWLEEQQRAARQPVNGANRPDSFREREMRSPARASPRVHRPMGGIGRR